MEGGKWWSMGGMDLWGLCLPWKTQSERSHQETFQQSWSLFCNTNKSWARYWTRYLYVVARTGENTSGKFWCCAFQAQRWNLICCGFMWLKLDSVQMNKPHNARAFALYTVVLSRTLPRVQHTVGVEQPCSCNNRAYMFKFCTNNSIPLICQNTTKYSEVKIVFLENSSPDGSYNNSFCYERIIRWGICF